jgi:hypothetical protein
MLKTNTANWLELSQSADRKLSDALYVLEKTIAILQMAFGHSEVIEELQYVDLAIIDAGSLLSASREACLNERLDDAQAAWRNITELVMETIK